MNCSDLSGSVIGTEFSNTGSRAEFQALLKRRAYRREQFRMFSTAINNTVISSSDVEYITCNNWTLSELCNCKINVKDNVPFICISTENNPTLSLAANHLYELEKQWKRIMLEYFNVNNSFDKKKYFTLSDSIEQERMLLYPEIADAAPDVHVAYNYFELRTYDVIYGCNQLDQHSTLDVNIQLKYAEVGKLDEYMKDICKQVRNITHR